MAKKSTLTASERDFFRTVAQAAFANPFSQTRIDLDRTIAGTSSAMSWDDLVVKATERIIITRHYKGDSATIPSGNLEQLMADIDSGTMDAQALLADYCTLLYQRHGTYEEVARRTRLDRRTVKKYIQREQSPTSGEQP